MILSDRTIRRYCMPPSSIERDLQILSPMIEPFCERTLFEGMSYGLSHCGYDIRIAEEVQLASAKNVRWTALSFKLASTIEKFDMPNDIVGVVHDKSSWARKGLAVQNTVLEPGWRGYLTLELSNHGPDFLWIKPGTPIAQVIFHRLDQPCENPYTGKYQNQPREAVAAIEEK